MALKVFNIFLFAIILLFGVISHNVLVLAHFIKSSQFIFLERLEGSAKGDSVEGISQLKKYLTHFGYLNNNPKTINTLADDYFDEFTEAAIKDYQLFYNLKVTGKLDRETISQMMVPRCGLPDKVRYSLNYKFPGGDTKWAVSKRKLTFAFAPNTRSDALDEVDRAFKIWENVTKFRFNRIQEFDRADIRIGFYTKAGGDSAMDGPGGVVAYGTPPNQTDPNHFVVIHFDGDDKYVVGDIPGTLDIRTVALHEIGHNLGLDHSTVQGAVMFPSGPDHPVENLHDDDVQGIRALYSEDGF